MGVYEFNLGYNVFELDLAFNVLHYATSQKVEGLSPDKVIGFFN
jgi:hypothetical protein